MLVSSLLLLCLAAIFCGSYLLLEKGERKMFGGQSFPKPRLNKGKNTHGQTWEDIFGTPEKKVLQEEEEEVTELVPEETKK